MTDLIVFSIKVRPRTKQRAQAAMENKELSGEQLIQRALIALQTENQSNKLKKYVVFGERVK
jgi:hypothetical protein